MPLSTSTDLALRKTTMYKNNRMVDKLPSEILRQIFFLATEELRYVRKPFSKCVGFQDTAVVSLLFYFITTCFYLIILNKTESLSSLARGWIMHTRGLRSAFGGVIPKLTDAFS